jgi:phosphohistidine phosphatase
MILYIVRHAWAEDRDDSQWSDDAERPLTEEGRQRFAQVVKTLASRGFAPELVATSPLVRCRQTAELIAKKGPGKPALVERGELQPGSDLGGMLRWTDDAAVGLNEIAWVGHAPDVDLMTAALIGDPSGNLRFSKGAVAAIEFPDLPKLREGELRWLVTAKILGL